MSNRSRSALLGALTIAMSFLVLVAAIAMPTGSRVVVVAGPFGDRHPVRIVTEAGGRLVAMGRRDFLAVAEGEGDDFTKRLFAAGAWLVLDGRFAEACMRENAI
ncbi:hypothetical protein DYI37_08595 [Fulvimarina endophytica]|uniref:Uncharacterized protein n=1 Tax=Fulvimarina endophytica TaxID=2293836 RepID=A0A371X558_9HYPH|nr:hypothetical protein [Fulvimarina endophytica]RFC64368.1 hypothetical protein DYI37_08595 [Fulvimarina endophytica]